MLSFTAIDFETADYQRDSACALAMVKVQDGQIVDTMHELIRPPRRRVVFSYLHGLTYEHLQYSDTFPAVWRRMKHMLEGSDFIAAHNTQFDRGVLSACCWAARIQPPGHRWLCTVKLARRTWRQTTNALPAVCSYLDIPLNHHNAESDALACARIILAAQEDGAAVRNSTEPGLRNRKPWSLKHVAMMGLQPQNVRRRREPRRASRSLALELHPSPATPNVSPMDPQPPFPETPQGLQDLRAYLHRLFASSAPLTSRIEPSFDLFPSDEGSVA